MNLHQMAAQQTLRIALGDYPHTAALKNKEITSDRVALDFTDITPVYKAFAEWCARPPTTSAKWRSSPFCRRSRTASRWC